ncbi:MAG: hypothetical protein F9K44_04420 [Hyphomicrobiaceae bacterium]|nr:MAG: hypothetical protein F9K44_04420 [Hyphomicrobiaceae bacterium]
MTQKKDEATSSQPRDDQSGQKRPFATIDLTATEVKGQKGDATKAAGEAMDAAPRNEAPDLSAERPGRLFAYAAAAVIGGIVALVGSGYVGPMIGLSSPAGLDRQAADRIAKLERAVAERRTSPAEAQQLQKLTQQVSAANQRVDQLEQKNAQLADLAIGLQKLGADTKAIELKLGQKPEADAETAQRFARLEETLKGLAAVAQTPQGQQVPEIARLSAKLNDLETAMLGLKKSLAPELMAEVGTQTQAAVEARLAEARKSEARTGELIDQLKNVNTKITTELEAIKTGEAKLVQLMDSIRAETAKLDQSLTKARADTGSLKADIDALRSEMTAQLKNYSRPSDIKTAFEPFEKRLGEIDQRLASVVRAETERQTSAQRILVALELGNLKRALDAGRPFAQELAQVERVAKGKIDLAPLKPQADKGVPTIAALQAKFSDVVAQVLDAEQTSKQGSVVDSLLASAKSVVQIRRIGANVEGNTPEAVLARAEAHLKAGNLEQANKEMQSLKPELKAAAKGWLGQLEARLAVDRALKGIEEGLKSSLTGGSGE